MIKILFVITKSNWGGAQKYVFDLAYNLPKNDFDVAVAAGGRDGLLIKKLKEANIKIIPIPRLQRDVNFIKEILSLWSLFKIYIKERPDVIHLNSTKIGGLGAVAVYGLRLYGLLASLRWQSGRPKVIFTVHGWGFNEERHWLYQAIIYFLQWITVLMCDRVVAVSGAILAQGARMPFVSNKFVLIYNGLTPSEFLSRETARSAISSLSKTNINEDEFPRLDSARLVIGTIAELTKNKGLVYLVGAYKILKDSGINFYGFVLGEGEDRKILENLIAKYNLRNIVYLPGFVPDATKYLKAFDIFVLPSLTEALAYVLIEAGYAGLPVVATNVGGLPEIVENEKGGYLVPAKNPEALAVAIKKLLENESLRNQMGKANHDSVSQKFSFDRMLKETIDIYNEG